MPERLGKHQIRELIGRRGVATIDTARAPVLGRLVSIAVGSGEVQVIDELAGIIRRRRTHHVG
jgi:hypothetical protein